MPPEIQDPEQPPVPEQTPDPEQTPAHEPTPLEIVKDIKSKVDQMSAAKPDGAAPMTPQQMREAIKEKTGYTDEQVDFHFNSLAEAMAPMREQMTWMTLEKKFKDIGDLKPEMEEELKAYPAPMRGDPVLMEKVYFMTKGKKMSNQPTPQPAPQRQPAPQQNNVVSRRVANDYPGFTPSSDNSSGGGRQVQLSNEQREFARRMGQSEESYIEHMDRKPVRDFLTK